MISQPITIIEPQIRALADGRLTRLFRPVGRLLGNAGPGTVLWVREPFWLPSCYNHLAPSQAAARGAVPNFVADFSPDELLRLSPKRRNARELLRAWHRQHLRVTSVNRLHLQTITNAEIEDQGFANRSAFAEAWDNNLALAQAGNSWSANPVVLVLDFERVFTPAFAPVPA